MLTLSADPDHASRAMEWIRGRHELELGELQDRWLPVVADTRDQREAKDLHRWLEDLPGVEQVGVILVAFDESNS